ncbi:MAG: hypothetical protein CVU39_15585 [Chloroflexi bacterium HGW-Chloroflexi-10]|nr:MAG: hypothetical protein CVU39_15585 [Chloroflexi bacterium HGW-Chloroflexi-10]
MNVKFLQSLPNTQTIAQNPFIPLGILPASTVSNNPHSFVPYSFQNEYSHLYNQIALNLTFYSKARHLCWSFSGKSFVSIGIISSKNKKTNAQKLWSIFCPRTAPPAFIRQHCLSAKTLSHPEKTTNWKNIVQ